MKTINSGWTMALVALGLAGGVFAGCSGDPTPGPSVVDSGALTPTTRGTGMTVMLMVGPEGGTIALESLSLTVPPGALTSVRTLSVTSSMEAAPTGDTAYSPVYRFEPEGLAFARPVVVRVAVGADSPDPALYWTRLGSDEFEQVGAGAEGGVVRGEVTHFSRGFAARRRAAMADGGARDVPAGIDATVADVPAVTDAPAGDVTCTVPGTRYCGAAVGCVTIFGNDLHCGRCDNACVAGQYCVLSDCVNRPADAAVSDVPAAPGDGGGGCPAPLSACGVDCRNLTSDRNHCGACGNVCPVMGPGLIARCTASVCGAQCGEFLRNCDGDLTNGCEVRTDGDASNCGGCGVVCPAGQTCQSSACVAGDAGTADVRPTDVGAADVGPVDTGAMDAPATDAGPVDAGAADVRPLDSGPVDTGSVDTGSVDTGPMDTGPADVGCVAGLTSCGGACVNLTSDRNHCGACAVACPSGQGCYAGVCATCGGATPDNCSGTCTDVRRDVNNCSACGVACLPRGANEISQCESSVCSRQCRSFFAECDGNPATICETDVGASNANCGACGTVCAAGLTCITGACRCPAGLTLCGGACIDVTTNRSHCGGCGMTCTASQACTAGVCTTVTCSAGETNCSGSCVSLALDPRNCGSCGQTCTTTQYCNMRACVACAAGLQRCTDTPGLMCVNPQTDARNCGACGTVCTAAYAGGEGFCAAGACGTRCATFRGNCDGSLVNGCETDLNNDRNNCGACGTVCPAGQRCQEQSCIP